MIAQIWKQLPEATQHTVLEGIFPIQNDDLVDSARVRLAEVLHFREVFVRRMKRAELEGYLRKYFHRLGSIGVDFLVDYFLNARQDLLIAFYDALGIEHDGLIVPDEVQEAHLKDEAFIKAIESLADDFPLEERWLCMATMSFKGYPGWLKASAAAETHLRLSLSGPRQPQEGRAGPQIAAGDTAPVTEVSTSQEALPPSLSAPEFTTLDELLIRTMVSTMNEVEGSLEPEQLDDLVAELADLNDRRHRSYFHQGFVDSLLEREIVAWKAGFNRARRSWYLVGHILGSLRKQGEEDVLSLVKALGSRDKNLLLDSRQEAPRMLAPYAIRAAFSASEPGVARKWLKAHGISSIPHVIGEFLSTCEDWFRAGKHLREANDLLSISEALIGDRRAQGDEPPGYILDLIREHRATALRLEGHHVSSMAILDELLEKGTEDGNCQRWAAQKALASMGIRRINQLGAEERGDKRNARIEEIRHNQALLKEAEQGADPSPIALFALALPDVLEPESPSSSATDAEERLRCAIGIMVKDGQPLWDESGLLPRARFYLTLLELRHLDEGIAEAVTDRLKVILQSGIAFPTDLILEAVNHAVFMNAPGVSELATWGLGKYRHRALELLDLEASVSRSPHFSDSLSQLLERDKAALQIKERWSGWAAILKGSMRATPRRVSDAERALDHLEQLSEYDGCGEQILALLEEKEQPWDPAWSKGERDICYLKTLLLLGRDDEARSQLQALAHGAITASDADSAEGYLEELERCGESAEVITGLRNRLAAIFVELGAEDEVEPSPVSLLWIGGNETQATYRQRIEEELMQSHPEVQIEFIFSGWSSNWDKHYEVLKPRIDSFDAVVVSRYMRTTLGRKIRALVGEHDIPWRSCTGTGYGAMMLAIKAAMRACSGSHP